MTIATIVEARSTEVVRVAEDATVGAAAALLAEHRIGAMPVMDGDELLGIISERDIVHCLAVEGAAVLGRSVRAVMTSPAITAMPETGLLEALSLMTSRRIRHLPVMRGGRMIGFVSIGDLVKARIDAVERDAAALRSYIQSA